MTNTSKGNRRLAPPHNAEATVAAERLIATWTAVAVFVVVVFLLVRNEPFADPNLVVVFRIALSLSIGLLGGTIPGFLNVSYSVRGKSLRAGGALALFVIAFFASPAVEVLHLPPDPIIRDRMASQPTQPDANQPAAPTTPPIDPVGAPRGPDNRGPLPERRSDGSRYPAPPKSWRLPAFCASAAHQQTLEVIREAEDKYAKGQWEAVVERYQCAYTKLDAALQRRLEASTMRDAFERENNLSTKDFQELADRLRNAFAEVAKTLKEKP